MASPNSRELDRDPAFFFLELYLYFSRTHGGRDQGRKGQRPGHPDRQPTRTRQDTPERSGPDCCDHSHSLTSSRISRQNRGRGGAVVLVNMLPQHCPESVEYFEPCAIAEALIALTSGVLIWMGWWDLLEILLPRDWYWRLILIILGAAGLFATRTLYDQATLNNRRRRRRTRSRSDENNSSRDERPSASMLSSMEMATIDRSHSAVDVEAQSDGGGGADVGGGARLTPSRGDQSPMINPTRGLNAAVEQNACAAEGESPPHSPGGMPLFFNAPPPDARLCGRALWALIVGLTVWVGIWDLIDYNLLPALFTAANSTGCMGAEAHPGPSQLWRAPGCVVVKLLLVFIGVVGLWVTRALYGSGGPGALAQYRPYQ